MSTSGRYHKYIGECHAYIEGGSEHRRDIMIYVGDIMNTSRG